MNPKHSAINYHRSQLPYTHLLAIIALNSLTSRSTEFWYHLMMMLISTTAVNINADQPNYAGDIIVFKCVRKQRCTLFSLSLAVLRDGYSTRSWERDYKFHILISNLKRLWKNKCHFPPTQRDDPQTTQGDHA